MTNIDTIQQLIQALDTSSIACMDIITDILALPPFKDLPRPGQAKTWSFRDWLDWGKPRGFVEQDKTTHSFVMAHPVFKGLIVSPSSSPGDFRSPMATATEARNKFRDEYFTLAGMAQIYAIENKDVEGLDVATLKDRIRSFLVEHRHDEIGRQYVNQYVKKACVEDHRIAASGVVCGGGQTAKLKRLVDKAADLLKTSPKIIVSRAVEQIDNEITDVLSHYGTSKRDKDSAKRLSHNIYESISKEIQLADIVSSQLCDVFELMIAIEESAIEDRKQAKQKANLERKEERDRKKAEAKAAATVAVDTPEEFAKAMAGIREKFALLTQPVVIQMGELSAKIGEIVNYSTKFPSPAYPAQRLIKLADEVEDLTRRLDETEDKVEDLTESNAELMRANEKLKTEYAAAESMLDNSVVSAEWQSEYEKLVAALGPLLAPADFLELADGVRAARSILVGAKAKIEASRLKVGAA